MKTPRRKLIDKLDEICRLKVKERDKGICQHCGKKVSGCDAHCSHVIPKSRGYVLRWDLLNLKLLCFHCHINWFHKSPLESGKWFKNKFPERWEHIEPRINQTCKLSIPDLEDKIKELGDG